MYTATALLVLAASSASAFTLAEPGSPVLVGRASANGWSLQSDSAPDGLTSCGGGSYCPASMHCNDAKNMEVAACCPDSGNCVGDVEGSPSCADASWNLFVGLDGNGFCCEVGKVGVVDDSTKKTVGCVDKSDVGSQTTALLTKSGTRSSATASSSSASASQSASSSQVVVVTTSGSSTITSTQTLSSGSSSTGASSSASDSASSASASASQTAVPGAADRNQLAMGVMAVGLMAVAAL